MNRNISDKTVRFVSVSMLAAIIVLLQFFAGQIPVGATSFSVVLVPIVLGGMLFGVGAGSLLGLVFGLVTLIMGISGLDAFTSTLFQQSPVIITLICIVKATLAGFVSALVFRAVQRKNAFLAVVLSAVSAPVVNTGVFILGSIPLKNALINTGYIAHGAELFTFLIIGCAGINFLVEFGVNAVLTPALYKVVTVVGRKLKNGHKD